MIAFERLIKTGKHLDVFMWNDGDRTGIGVNFQNCDIKDGDLLIDKFGRGITLNDACEDYIRIITGKTLVFDGCTEKRKEVLVI